LVNWYYCYEEACSKHYSTLTPFDPTGYRPYLTPTGGVTWDPVEEIDVLEVASIKRPGAPANEPFNLQDLAILGSTFQTLNYDVNQNGLVDDAKYDLGLLLKLQYNNQYRPYFYFEGEL